MTWEESLIKELCDKGWINDVNDDQRLGFILYQDEDHEWIRDYDKSTRRFISFNGKSKVNLKTTCTSEIKY